MIELREDQKAALGRLRDCVGGGCKRLIMQAPTGFGKTVLSAGLVDSALQRKKRVLFTVPAIALIDQTVEMFHRQGITEVGVIQANHPGTDWSQPVQVASVQTLQKRPLPQADVALIDECFSAGTIIETIDGSKPIEQIQVGEIVHNGIAGGWVRDIVEQRKKTIKVRLSNGTTLRVTKDHPFFTDYGWREAKELEVGTRLFSREALHAMRHRIQAEGQAEWESDRGEYLEQAEFLLYILFEEVQQSDVEVGSSGTSVGDTSRARSRAKAARRKWSPVTIASEYALEGVGIGMGSGISGADETAARQRVSDMLQDRHSKSDNNDWYRGGRGEPCWRQNSTGQEEGCHLGDIWVEDISGEESESLETVYNLKVSGHPSYFAGGVLVHNCHRWFKFYERWLHLPEWENVPIIGLSATPWTKGLGSYFKELIVANTTENLINQGLLSPFKVFAPSHPDLKGVHTVAGDYHEGELAERMNKAELVADIIETWKTRAEDRPTLCFAVDRVHAKHLQQQFLAAGISAGYQDAYTPSGERAMLKRQFHNGDLKVVCNVGTLTTGVDWDVRCIVMARPTKSEILFTQIVGRGLRTADGKENCMILDHSDNHIRLGFVTDIDEKHQGLHNGQTPLANEKVDKITLPKECPKCSYLKLPKTAVCPNCGFKAEAHSKIQVEDGELVELQRKKKPKPVFNDKEQTYRGLLWISKLRGYSDGWVSHKYKEIFGAWPKGFRYCSSLEPTPDLLEFVRRDVARYARQKRRSNGNGHTNGHTLTPREQHIIANVAKQFVPGTLCTTEDFEVDL